MALRDPRAKSNLSAKLLNSSTLSKFHCDVAAWETSNKERNFQFHACCCGCACRHEAIVGDVHPSSSLFPDTHERATDDGRPVLPLTISDLEVTFTHIQLCNCSKCSLRGNQDELGLIDKHLFLFSEKSLSRSTNQRTRLFQIQQGKRDRRPEHHLS